MGLLVAHGPVHALGFVSTWDLADVAELGGPSLFLTDRAAGDPALMAFGLSWLVAVVAVVGAGIGAA